MWYLRRVKGDSMKPSYTDGQIILVSQSRDFQVGDVVVAYADNREVLKRIAKVDKLHGQVYLLGDNSKKSKDSRSFGKISDTKILAKVIWPKT